MRAPLEAPGRRRRRGRAAGRGFSLVEIVVAIAVLAIGTVAALGAFRAAGREGEGLALRFLALEVAATRADEIRLLGLAEAGALPAEVAMGRHRFAIALGRQPTRGGLVETAIAVHSPDGPGARLVVHFPAPAP